MDKQFIIAETAKIANWWASQRLKKIRGLSNETMAQNPFLIPLIAQLHGYRSPEELASFVIEGHLSVGHATGFGKLIDEKILPEVFKTEKLSKAYRKKENLTNPIFDEIDHIVFRDNQKYLLSLKAGRWTIQLTMAVQLNRSFSDIIEARSNGMIDFNKIIVGIFYGKEEALTDKYRIIRGVCSGAQHDVVNLQSEVDIVCGKDFWCWLNDGQLETQSWVLEGLMLGVGQVTQSFNIPKMLNDYKENFCRQLLQNKTASQIDWMKNLEQING